MLVIVGDVANGPVGLVTFYEPEVQERAIELDLTTRERIGRNAALAGMALFVPALPLVPCMVYGLNGAQGFLEDFTQMAVPWFRAEAAMTQEHPQSRLRPHATRHSTSGHIIISLRPHAQVLLPALALRMSSPG